MKQGLAVYYPLLDGHPRPTCTPQNPTLSFLVSNDSWLNLTSEGARDVGVTERESDCVCVWELVVDCDWELLLDCNCWDWEWDRSGVVDVWLRGETCDTAGEERSETEATETGDWLDNPVAMKGKYVLVVNFWSE